LIEINVMQCAALISCACAVLYRLISLGIMMCVAHNTVLFISGNYESSWEKAGDDKIAVRRKNKYMTAMRSGLLIN
jgi:hypothetical protein